MYLDYRCHELIDLLLSSQKSIEMVKKFDVSFSAKIQADKSVFNIRLFSEGKIHITEHIFEDIELSQADKYAIADGYYIPTEEKIAEVNSEFDFEEGLKRIKEIIKS